MVLFVDTFNGHFETENAVAAVRVLQAAGYARARGARRRRRARCAAAARYLAAGMADEAKARRATLLDALLPFAERGIAIVGLEPSCLLTLRDEMLVDGPRRRRGDASARQALLFEEFLVREARAGRFAPALRPADAADAGARPLPPEGVRRGADRCSRCCG